MRWTEQCGFYLSAGRLLHIVTSLFLLGAGCAANNTTARHWTQWYNSDNPSFGYGADIETVERISRMLSAPCGGSEHVVAAQCRQTGHSATFQQQAVYGRNVLHVPCNSTGVVCRDQDQVWPENALCADYQVRFLCWAEGNSSRTNNDDDITSHGAFVAMAAGGSVILPLVVVLLLQLRKAKQAERRQQQQGEAQRAAQEGASAEEASSADAAPPPPYEELFGSAESASLTSADSGVGSAAGHAPTRDRAETGTQLSSSRGASGDVPQGTRVSRGTSPTFPPSMTVAVTMSEASPSAPGSSNVSGGAAPPPALPLPPCTRWSSAPALLRRYSTGSSSSSSVSLSSSNASTDSLLPGRRSPGRRVTHRDPPPMYVLSGPRARPGQSESSSRGHVSLVIPAEGNDVAPSGPTEVASPDRPSGQAGVASPDTPSGRAGVVSPERVTPRRALPGMHLSIFDLMATMYPGPTSPLTPTPPPTYDDALRILGVPGQAGFQFT